ncbi:FAD-dependent oxidoreductase [Mycena chlorophos]|uniref:FAD-dependent oxidoreductase n=1 Tax=Mycena chlorophos TaxID=658473 RepID=A0A8H6W334_MYCCL|nr:FAD-dependent oxidoreductase [Mycena chlorophos]
MPRPNTSSAMNGTSKVSPFIHAVRSAMATTSTAPGYPRPNPTVSFWLANAAKDAPLGPGYRTTPELPAQSDVTVVGSGLSGAATAYFLLTGDSPPEKVTLLEAREVCDGATARNGGHCRPDYYRGYRDYKAEFGAEQALKIIQNEKDTLALVEEIVRKEGLECDFWKGYSYDVPMSEFAATYLDGVYNEFAADGGPVDGLTRILDPEEARKTTRCPRATAAYRFMAGSLYPYKLVQQLLKLCIDKYGLNVQTQTVVRRVVESGEKWVLETDRGNVKSGKVVLATNAFTATLLPELEGHIWPFKGTCSAVLPPRTYAGDNALNATYGLNYGDYLIQRDNDIIIFGGARRSVPVDQLIGNTDDGSVIPEMAEDLRNALPAYFADWDASEGQITHVWSGVMGYTSSGIPFVGEMPARRGGVCVCGASWTWDGADYDLCEGGWGR